MTIEKEIKIKISTEGGDKAQKEIDEIINKLRARSSGGGPPTPRAPSRQYRDYSKKYWEDRGEQATGGGRRGRSEEEKEYDRNARKEAKSREQARRWEEKERDRQEKSTNKYWRSRENQATWQDGFDKKWRKTITGILIDLHVIRIMGQHSMVVSNMFNLLARSLGVLVDVALIPLIPSFVAIAKVFFGFAMALQRAHPAIRIAIGAIIAVGLALVTLSGYFVIMKVITEGVTAALTKLGISANAAAAAESAKTGALAGLGPVAVGIGLGGIGVILLNQLGVLKASYELGKKTRKWLQEDLLPRILKYLLFWIYALGELGNMLVAALNALANALKALPAASLQAGVELYDALKDYAVDTLFNIYDFAKAVWDAFLKWVSKSFENVSNFAKEIWDHFVTALNTGDWVGFVKGVIEAVITFVQNQLRINTDFVNQIIRAIVKFVYNQLKDTVDLAREIKNIIVRFFNNLFPGVGDKIGSLMEAAWNFVIPEAQRSMPEWEYTPYGAAEAIDKWWDKIHNAPAAASGGYVERTGYAKIHKGETIVPASGANVTIPITIYGSDRQYADFLSQHLKNELRRVKGVGI